MNGHEVVPHFDMSINLGNLITISFGVVALIVAWQKLGGRLDMLEFRVKAIEETLKILSSVIKTLADNERDILLLRTQVVAIETDLAATNKILEALRRGEGFIQSGRRRNSVDGEY